MTQKLLQQLLSFGLVVFFLVGCSTPAPVATATPIPATPTLTPIPLTPTPGIGVPAADGNWEVTITNADKTTEWFGRNTKSGFVFLLIDVTFHNLKAAPGTTVSAGDITIQSEDGKTLSPAGIKTDSANGNVAKMNGTDISSVGDITCIDCAPIFESNEDTLGFTLVFVLPENAAGKTLRFQFQKVQIPFQVN